LASFGTRLKQQREQRGITLDAVALSTKIGTRFLRALEEDHFDQLPGGIFNRGFVRAYARCVGLDEDQTIADYLVASGEAQPKTVEAIEPVRPVVSKEEEVGKEEKDKPAPNLPWGMLALVLVVVVLGLAIWRFFSRESSSGSAPTGSESMSPSPIPAKTLSPAPPATGGQNLPAASTGVPEVPNASPPPASFTVLIKASEDSWVSVTDADGKPIFEDTMEAFAEKSIEARGEIKVKVGNLGGLDFWFNGTKLSSQGDEGEVKTLVFDANGLRPTPPKPQDPGTSPPQP
jgi:cytoskeleton protein RodZ